MYKNINPERIIRAIKFDNKKGARSLIKDEENCFEKDATYNEKCPLNVNIDKILKKLIKETETVDNIEDVDVSTEICGVKLENPFLLSSSIVGSRYEMCKRALELVLAIYKSAYEGKPVSLPLKNCSTMDFVERFS